VRADIGGSVALVIADGRDATGVLGCVGSGIVGTPAGGVLRAGITGMPAAGVGARLAGVGVGGDATAGR
jgi:hypothetical protein